MSACSLTETLRPPSYPALEAEAYAAEEALDDVHAAALDYLRAADDLTRRGLFTEAEALLEWHDRLLAGARSAAPRPWAEVEVDVLFADLCDELCDELAA